MKLKLMVINRRSIVKRVATMFTCVFALLFTQMALAGYITYTYTSQPLDWRSTTLYYSLQLEPPPPEVEPPFFQFSFRLLDTLLSPVAPTRVGMLDPVVHLGPGDTWDGRLQASSKGDITVNPDGSIAAWDIDLHLTEMNPARSEYIRAARNSMSIFTSGGGTSCNCDLLRTRTNVFTQRHNSYLILGPMESIYSDTNSFSYWSVVRDVDIKVAEPGMASLILMGLGLLGLRQIRRRKPDDLNRAGDEVTNKASPNSLLSS